ncbi:Ankyrin repeat and MYND domain-containing protein [Echinococcus granulosus]|uniref:Ankyrin repeat and MYND domain-containing protein n=1 Tax=Echinococcus granulosus TaxID=6210 RepID=W6UQY3_ECHGR|nr:Ankyrin repeat and MYND domain-containing protein [Echinococcus granulosus]EUB55829.1 Ankyrin repeat and MYND domain-containing protein [Echinococcus granulosus]
MSEEPETKISCSTVQQSNGETYVGALLSGQLHGFGTLNTPSYGYVGTFCKGLRQGIGISLFPNDHMFMGFYKADERSGLGISIRGNSEIDIGLWKANSLIKVSTSILSQIKSFQSPVFTRCLIENSKFAKEEIFTIPDLAASLPSMGRRRSPDECSNDHSKEFSELPLVFFIRKNGDCIDLAVENDPDEILNREVNCNGPITRVVERLYCAAECNDLHSIRQILTNTLEFSCRLLISEGHPLRYDVSLSDMYGITPLHVASANQSVEVVDFLLSYGADPNASMVNGMRPITLCTLFYLERHSSEHSDGYHLIELGIGQTSSGVYNRAELVWLLGYDASESPASNDEDCGGGDDDYKIHRSDDEGYIETGVLQYQKTLLHTRERVDHVANSPRFDKYMSCNQYLKALTWDITEMPTPGGLVSRKSKRPCRSSALTKATQVTQADLKEIRKSIRIRARLKTMLLLLQHGANPNIAIQPLPPLIAAARAGDVELSRLLLHFDADPNIRIPPHSVTMSETTFTDNHGNIYTTSAGGLTALHFAVVLPGAVGVQLTQMLLQRGANPNLRALPDASFLVDIEGKKSTWSTSTCDGGRTALHLACAKTYDKQHATEIVKLLIHHSADANLLCNGHCALSLALACGNDEIVSLLLTYPQTKVGMRLTHGLGSSLCVLLHPIFEHVRTFDSRLSLLSQLIAHCPSGLLNHRITMPYELVEGNIVDYVLHVYTRVEKKVLGDPAKRHILQQRQRILDLLAAELRKSAFASETWRRVQDLNHAGSLMEINELQFCFHCGRSLGVNLSPCRRCRLVLFCSNSCRRGAWMEWHGRQCLHIMGLSLYLQLYLILPRLPS